MSEQSDTTTYPLNTEETIYNALNQFFYCYLTERNIEHTLASVTEDIFSIGTGNGEIAVGKEEFRALLEAEMSALPSPIAFEVSDFHGKWRCDDCCECFCYVKTSISVPENKSTISYSTRLTASFRREGTRFLADTLHMSVGSSYQETDEFFPIEFASEQMNCLNREAQHDLIEMMSEVMPGGVLGGYYEKDFPLYIANDRLLTMAGYTYQEFLEDTDGLVMHTIHPDDQDYVWRSVTTQLSHSLQYEIEYRMKRKDGSYFWVYDVGRKTVTNEGREAIVSLVIDISEQVRTREQLKNESIRDALTGLLNRKGGTEAIEKSLAHTDHYLFFMMDLDNFKLLNDNYGHASGDDALRYVARLLSSSFRKTDIICRLGGDEFAIFIADCHNVEIMERKLHTVMETYHTMISEQYPLSHSSLSFGGIYSHNRHTFQELYQKADELLYQVKNGGKGYLNLCEL